MSEHQVERGIRKRQLLAVGHLELARESLLIEIRSREMDGRWREVDAGHACATFGKPGEVDAGAAPHVEHAAAAIAVEIHEPQQMVKLFEMVLVEIVEEAP